MKHLFKYAMPVAAAVMTVSYWDVGWAFLKAGVAAAMTFA